MKFPDQKIFTEKMTAFMRSKLSRDEVFRLCYDDCKLHKLVDYDDFVETLSRDVVLTWCQDEFKNMILPEVFTRVLDDYVRELRNEKK